MLTVSAFVTLHCKVELCPVLIEAGVAVKLPITGRAGPTVTEMLQVVITPVLPVAVTVYALLLVHASIDDWPAVMLAGVAVHADSAGMVGRVTTCITTD